MSARKKPAECQSKQDVRAEIDRIDQILIQIFAERHTYVSRMAQIKTSPDEALQPQRIEDVIAKVRARAKDCGLDEKQAELIWRTLIDWNIEYEEGIIAARTSS
jgi:isochorismate pyruvate lyase